MQQCQVSPASNGAAATSYANARVWVLPNPSGLNRTFTLRRLIQHYSALREEADHYLGAWEKAQATSAQT